ncbi:FAD-dependent oxidoreductase [Ralstonia sp. Ralssp135]|uniref:FAD-dependent oxidoreductase n=1 Tax=Ralstonia sp. Ralssp135 TaxID=3243016 RepID=UPI0039B04267
MNIVVVGAGISGTVTALTLAREGHRVQLIERADAAATGASFANAGLISPGHSFSWAEPGIIQVALRSLFRSNEGLGICAPWKPALLRWALLFAREATLDQWLSNSRAALALAAYSRDMQFGDPLVPPEAYGGRQAGILYLYGNEAHPGPHDAGLLAAAGEPFERVNTTRLADIEPMLRTASEQFVHALYCPTDGTGDAARYAHAALAEAVRLGAEVRFSETVRALKTRGDCIVGVETERDCIQTDAVVIATGLASRRLLEPLGYDLPIYPVTGYSISYTGVRDASPRVGAVSIPHKIAWASFAPEAVRFTGFADIGEPSPKRVAQRLAALEAFAATICTRLKHAQPSRWVGYRPMTPDNLPFLGATRHANLWLNCGHGAMGWTMACGSARTVADLISRRQPVLDLSPYRWDRYRLLGRR